MVPIKFSGVLGAVQALGIALALVGCTAGDGVTPQLPSDRIANRCAPDNLHARDANKRLLTGYTSGTLANEKAWLAGYFEDAYLWYAEMPAVDPNERAYNTGAHRDLMQAYFNALRTTAETAPGVRKDKYSEIQLTAEYNRLTQDGIATGYGVHWVGSTDQAPPRTVTIAYVEPRSLAEQLGLERGDQLLSVSSAAGSVSVDALDSDSVAVLNEVLVPSQRGLSADLELRSATGVPKQVTVTSGEVTSQPVLMSKVIERGSDRVGYLHITGFTGPAELQMIEAVDSFSGQNIKDLIVDLRYNGGGFMELASQLAYMVAGPVRTQGKVFERTEYNDKRTAENSTVDFLSATSGVASGVSQGVELPTLNLDRVIVLTSSATCSASESFINGLRGVDLDVVMVGGNTCGNPYGSVAKDNCGISYFPIEFKGVNDQGAGDYVDGMPVSCAASDDLTQPLGDPAEGLLAAALTYRGNGVCPAPRPPAAPVPAGLQPRALGTAAGQPAAAMTAALQPGLARRPVSEIKFLRSDSTQRASNTVPSSHAGLPIISSR